MTAEEYNKMSDSEKKKEDWMNSKWRPACGWMYIVVCLFDFMIAPILWSITQAVFHGGVNVQWQPLTLQGAGLFHVAMGAIIGVSAYGRTQEKLNGANNGGIALPSNVGTTYTPPAPIQQSATSNFGAPVATTVTQTFGTPGGGGFGSTPVTAPASGFGGNTGFGAPASADVVTGFGGKPAPVIPPFPER
jgi:hypothetical protein